MQRLNLKNIMRITVFFAILGFLFCGVKINETYATIEEHSIGKTEYAEDRALSSSCVEEHTYISNLQSHKVFLSVEPFNFYLIENDPVPAHCKSLSFLIHKKSSIYLINSVLLI